MLSHFQIAQRCHLPIKQAKSALAALVQLRLVQHHTTLGGFSTYQADVNYAYNLVRIGKVATLAHSKIGPVAALILEYIVSNGYAPASQISDKVNQLLPDDGKVSSLKINRILRTLASRGFLKKVQLSHFQILHDARNGIALQLQPTDAKAKSKKAQEQYDAQVKTELERRLDSYLSPESFDVSEDHENGMNGMNWSDPEVKVSQLLDSFLN